MSLQTFSFPLPETRFFTAGSFVYKFKIREGSSYSGEKVIGENYVHQELEDIIRAVLANLGSLQPFSSAHFNVFPYKRLWESVSKLSFKCGDRKLSAYPYIITLYLENNTQTGKEAEDGLTPPKRSKTDSPLEDAILKEIIMDTKATTQCPMVGITYEDNPQEQGEAEREDDERGTKQSVEPRWEACIDSQLTTAQGEVHSGTVEEAEEEEDEQEGMDTVEDVDSAPSSPERPGLLTRLVRQILPFSMFIKEK